MPNLRRLFALLLLAAPLAAQEELDPETGRALSPGALIVAPLDLADAWLELTPLAVEAPALLVRLADRATSDGELRLRPGVPDGAAMLCTAGESFGVLCEQVYVQSVAWVEPGEAADVEVRFEPGLAVRGRYLLDGRPVAGARIGVVPTGVPTARAFTMPLGLPRDGSASDAGSDAARREVESDEDGRFGLPPLAEGEYFLESVLPSGRVHRSEPFALPAVERARREAAAGDPSAVVWDLGEIDVADGLVIELEATDLDGSPVAGVRIAARQGETPETLVSYRAVTGNDGAARLSGFAVERELRVRCEKEGYRTVSRDYPLLPVLVDCVLEPLASVRGEVIASGGLPPPGATVSLSPLAAGAPSAAPVAADATGRFTVGELAAGEYELTAAAPGFEVATQPLVLEPGQHLELPAIVLLPGRELAAQVVDAASGKPIAGARARAVSPPGAAFAVSDEAGVLRLATRSEEALVLRLDAPEHAAREVTISPSQLVRREPLVIVMERGGRIRAVVWDEAAGLPCQSCRLRIEPRAGELSTDGHGEALSEALAPGWYRVHLPRVTHLGSTVVEQDDAEYRHVRVRRGETSTVRFGERRVDVRVVFRPSPGAGWTLSARTPWRAERYRQQPGGGFRVRHRQGESLDLFLHLWDAASASEIEVRQATLAGDHAAPELVLPLAGARLSGRATSGGAGLAGERVRLKALDDETWAAARTRGDGTFSFPHVPAGVYAVVVGERNVHFVSLRGGEAFDLGTVELIAGSY